MHDRPEKSDETVPSPRLLVAAYTQGIFPMADPRTGLIEWFSPDPRAILPLESFHVPGTLRRAMRTARFEIRSDTAFADVIRACAEPRESDQETWISEGLIESYVALHQRSFAHSVEAWLDDRLVGGLYGVQIGGAFFGESMFARPQWGGTNASKICLVRLVQWMRHRGFMLLDTQFSNPHIEQFGCVEIPRADYMLMLDRAIHADVSWGEFKAPLRSNHADS